MWNKSLSSFAGEITNEDKPTLKLTQSKNFNSFFTQKHFYHQFLDNRKTIEYFDDDSDIVSNISVNKLYNDTDT